MPTYRKPLSDEDRLTMLQASKAAGALDQAAGRIYLSQATLAAAQTQTERFTAARQALVGAEAAWRQALQEADAAREQIEVEVHSLWAAVRWQVRRQQASPALLTYYALPQSGPLRKPGTRQGWLNLAEQLLQGDEAAQAAGYAAVRNRDALQRAVTTMKTAVATLAAAETALRTARQALVQARQPVDQLCKEIVSELRYRLRHATPAFRRQVLRSYGLRFQGVTSEAQGEAAPTVTTATAV